MYNGMNIPAIHYPLNHSLSCIFIPPVSYSKRFPEGVCLLGFLRYLFAFCIVNAKYAFIDL